MCVVNKYSIKQSSYYYVDINHYCKYQTAKELKKIMASLMHDESLEGIEAIGWLHNRFQTKNILYIYLFKINIFLTITLNIYLTI